ncbi:hypothetical protein CEUSTIGMA_g4969.t1 [Chlamydomonas eustigma]|uniref:Uncharacterized protein n=1 Tax=Chlamydomonas eustigma TaxID=1157962 RepID=A0A250X392_9CHLO|nr:hypothetical protein CEUSTIGMA_g4969.t1 [Chlamydomonas eustigma]|eukprot:GAX77525.1 hypothetical protein CEUSTIGMA_g4969.t1 [Chlamydomonas eustigma]
MKLLIHSSEVYQSAKQVHAQYSKPESGSIAAIVLSFVLLSVSLGSCLIRIRNKSERGLDSRGKTSDGREDKSCGSVKAGVDRKSTGIVGKHMVPDTTAQRLDIVSQAAQRYMEQFSGSSLALPTPATALNNPNTPQGSDQGTPPRGQQIISPFSVRSGERRESYAARIASGVSLGGSEILTSSAGGCPPDISGTLSPLSTSSRLKTIRQDGGEVGTMSSAADRKLQADLTLGPLQARRASLGVGELTLEDVIPVRVDTVNFYANGEVEVVGLPISAMKRLGGRKSQGGPLVSAKGSQDAGSAMERQDSSTSTAGLQPSSSKQLMSQPSEVSSVEEALLRNSCPTSMSTVSELIGAASSRPTSNNYISVAHKTPIRGLARAPSADVDSSTTGYEGKHRMETATSSSLFSPSYLSGQQPTRSSTVGVSGDAAIDSACESALSSETACVRIHNVSNPTTMIHKPLVQGVSYAVPSPVRWQGAGIAGEAYAISVSGAARAGQLLERLREEEEAASSDSNLQKQAGSNNGTGSRGVIVYNSGEDVGSNDRTSSRGVIANKSGKDERLDCNSGTSARRV